MAYVNLDVSDWSLEGGVEFTFPDPTVVPGRDYLVVAVSPTALQAASGYSDALGPYTGRLSNGGEELRLINNDGRRMSIIEYGDQDAWPVAPDGGGPSLAKQDSSTATEPAENWTFSPEIGGTPGSANFPDQSGSWIYTTLLDSGAAVRAEVPSDSTDWSTWRD